MELELIKQRVREVKRELSGGNPFGEAVTLVAAIKTQTPEAINAAIEGGVDAVAENKPQEFRDKNALIDPCPRHFIGHLQTNKIKYLIGQVQLYHSCDRIELIEELAKASVKREITSDILLQINVGEEASKSGFALEDGRAIFERVSKLDGVSVRGFMAMLPDSDDLTLLCSLADKMRGLFEWGKDKDEKVKYLSMGMSGDYKLCIERGSNAVRLGSTLFGARTYQ
jgi:pyridoxal phosphate enzyme (YggS family)